MKKELYVTINRNALRDVPFLKKKKKKNFYKKDMQCYKIITSCCLHRHFIVLLKLIYSI